ncbi:hypothetical protein I4U23_025113 [Adineta vaga]|nr:hypothetical protein I4U23_025113 [Adineta vaga]
MSTLDTLAAQIPQELRVKLMQHFGIAKEYEKDSQTISVTYYCLMYIANEAFKHQKDKQFISNVLDHLETMKRDNSDDVIIKSMSTGQATIEQLVTILVGETNEAEDDEYKTPEQLRSLMRKHYTVGGLTDVLSVFGPVKDDFLTLGKIAKSRAVAIFRDLKAGGGSSAAVAPIKPPEKQSHVVSPPKLPSPTSYDQHASSSNVPFDIISQTQKLCRYASSALEHEDIATAIYIDVSILKERNMDDSQKLLEETILPDEIQRYRTVFEKAKEANQVTDQNKFSFAYCLVRSKVKTDVRYGLQLLKELYDSTRKDEDKRDYVFYLALGNARLNEYETAIKFLDAILHVQPGNHQAKNLKDEIQQRITRDGYIGAGIAVGAGALLVGGLAAAAIAILKK